MVLTLLLSQPARTISESAPRLVACAATSRHCLLVTIYPDWTCFVFGNLCGPSAAKLIFVFLLPSCVSCPVLSLSELPHQAGAKASLWVAPAARDCHQVFSPLLHPSGHEPAAPQPAAEHPAPLLMSARGNVSYLDVGFASCDPKEVRSP